MRALLILLAVVSSACGDREATPTLAERAATLSGATTDTLLIEGSPQAVAYREVRGSSFPLPFEVRVPDPMAVATDTSGDGPSVRLTMGAPPADAQWAVVVLPETAAEGDAQATARRAAEALGAVTDGTAAPTGALAAFETERAGRTGSVWLGRHAGRFFYVLSDAAQETGDGFGPRREYLLQNWRWLDDGTTLAE
ncbi:MAG TPA: hypothetical protein VF576_06590 [Rubricoccaceae bacterium]|jgi:hypothetical protein